LQQNLDGGVSDIRAVRDRALFCVRHTIELEPTWRSELRRLSDPNAPKDPVDNDLESFYTDPQFRAIIDPESEIGRRSTLADDISKTLLGFAPIPLVKYSGAVDGWIEDLQGMKVSRLAGGVKYLLIVEFAPTPRQEPRGVSERVEVREGEVRSEVPFDLHPDATDIRFQPDKISVMVPHQGPPLQCRFEFTAPAVNTSDIWVEIAQARRTIQMLQLPIKSS
jgi:hypothetical protein